MTRPKQVAWERWCAERFRRASGLDFEILPHDEERRFPDVMIRRLGSNIGLEVTDLHVLRDPSVPGVRASRAEHSHRAEVVRRAEHLYRERGGTPLVVLVRFENPRFRSVTKCNRMALGAALADALATAGRGAGRSWLDLRLADLSPIAAASFHRAPDGHPGRWSVVEVSSPVPMETSHVLPRIEAKNRRLEKNASQVDRCWLLMFVDRRSPASALLPPRCPVDLSTSRFEWTFVLFDPDDQVMQFPIVDSLQGHLAAAALRARG